MQTQDLIESASEPSQGVSRRDLFGKNGMLKAAGLVGAILAVSRRAHAQFPAVNCPTLLIFLRGGMDALSAIFPYGDNTYTTLRQSLALDDPTAGGNLALGPTFGMSKAASSLLVPYQAGRLAFALGVGSPEYKSQSHFASQDYSEIGIKTGTAPDGKGWLARYLSNTPPSALTLDALGFGVNVQLTIQGGPKTLAIPDPETFDLNGDPVTAPDRKVRLHEMYQQTDPPAKAAGIGSLDVINDLGLVNFNPTVGTYPAHPFGQAMRKASALLRYPPSSSVFGPRAMVIDFGGWDDHTDEQPKPSPTGSNYYDRLQALALSLRAFYDEMQLAGIPYQLFVMSEFGRRVDMNNNAGCDHGRGGLMMAMGNAQINGGAVYTRKPDGSPGWDAAGLINQLDAQSGGTTKNLLCNISWWDLMAEYFVKRCAVPSTQINQAFPGYTYNPLGMFF